MANNEEMYTSIYSGQEIDDAVGFGYNPDNLPTENSPRGVKSGGVFTGIKQAKETLETKIVNRNLLDNSQFRIDQRKGYLAPPDIYYYDQPSSQGVVVGTNDQYRTATYYNANWYSIDVGGTTYYVATARVVRGYIGNSTPSDRWHMWNHNDYPNITRVLYNDDGTITFTATTDMSGKASFYTKQADDLELGKPYTLSVAFRDGTINAVTQTLNSTSDTIYVPIQGSTNGRLYLGYASESPQRWCTTLGLMSAGESTSIKAVKLEEGSVSTLKYELDSDNYNKELDLWNCYKHLQIFDYREKGYTQISTGMTDGNKKGVFPLKLIRPMGKTPTAIYEGTYRIWGAGLSYANVVSITTSSNVATPDTLNIYVDNPLATSTLTAVGFGTIQSTGCRIIVSDELR